jgi:hypothetical protein
MVAADVYVIQLSGPEFVRFAKVFNSDYFRFEIAIFVLIFLNMVSMGIEHYDQARVITFTLEICNALFTTIFSLGE